ncbi:hypothetical protein BDR03DRAFT_947399 [Suillus americanus]|nr:hypothetical protein BDR03DRAFT_947399 [Suillus americanus]
MPIGYLSLEKTRQEIPFILMFWSYCTNTRYSRTATSRPSKHYRGYHYPYFALICALCLGCRLRVDRKHGRNSYEVLR